MTAGAVELLEVVDAEHDRLEQRCAGDFR